MSVNRPYQLIEIDVTDLAAARIGFVMSVLAPSVYLHLPIAHLSFLELPPLLAFAKT